MHLKIDSLIPAVFLFLIIFLSGSCTQKFPRETTPPRDLISRDTMVDIFVDLKLLDAIVIKEQRKSNRRTNELNYYLNNSIMNKYGISREQFDSSFYYYQNNLNVIDQIYMDAITRLTKMKSAVEREH